MMSRKPTQVESQRVKPKLSLIVKGIIKKQSSLMVNHKGLSLDRSRFDLGFFLSQGKIQLDACRVMMKSPSEKLERAEWIMKSLDHETRVSSFTLVRSRSRLFYLTNQPPKPII